MGLYPAGPSPADRLLRPEEFGAECRIGNELHPLVVMQFSLPKCTSMHLVMKFLVTTFTFPIILFACRHGRHIPAILATPRDGKMEIDVEMDSRPLNPTSEPNIRNQRAINF